MKPIFIIALLLLIELKYSPRLDLTAEKNLLLWYTKGKKRKYFKLW